MFDCFDPLGNDMALECTGKADHTLDNHQIVVVTENFADKTLVDLDDLRRQALEVGQRRIAGSKIVNREANAKCAAASRWPARGG